MENKPTVFENAEIALRQLLTDINNIPNEVQGVERVIACNELISQFVKKYQNCMEFPLPCGHQIGDQVILHFGASGSLAYAWVKNVKFTPAPIYDLDILLSQDEDGGNKNFTRIYGVSSHCVSSIRK